MFSTIIIILAYIFLVVGSICVALGFWQDWEETKDVDTKRQPLLFPSYLGRGEYIPHGCEFVSEKEPEGDR